MLHKYDKYIWSKDNLIKHFRILLVFILSAAPLTLIKLFHCLRECGFWPAHHLCGSLRPPICLFLMVFSIWARGVLHSNSVKGGVRVRIQRGRCSRSAGLRRWGLPALWSTEPWTQTQTISMLSSFLYLRLPTTELKYLHAGYKHCYRLNTPWLLLSYLFIIEHTSKYWY
jgi:hypothetical protein